MITLIDYNAGNLTSVRNSLMAVGAEVHITSRAEEVRGAERIVFPGVGAARAAMEQLSSLDLIDALREAVSSGVPLLGICLGTQILLDCTEEDDNTDVLGILPGKCVRFQSPDPLEKIPQIGWNQVRIEREHPLLKGISDENDFYFVHSYYPVPRDHRDVIGSTSYAGVRFASMIGRDNLVATQFHPEKSGPAGLTLLKNFVYWTP